MRLEAEGSSSLSTYFGRCIQAGYRLDIRVLGLQNFYGPNHRQLAQALTQESMVDTHFLDMFGGAYGPRTNVFVDDTWKTIPEVLNFKWKVHRSNEFAMQHTRILRGFTGLEELYLVSNNLEAVDAVSDAQEAALPEPHTTSSAAQRPGVLPGPDLVNLGNEYLDAITTSHGATLRKLLLFDKFLLGTEHLATIVRCCPNLEQFGMAIGPGGSRMFGYLMPFLPKLQVLRVLDNEWVRKQVERPGRPFSELCAKVGRDMYVKGQKELRWLGMGPRIIRVAAAREFVLEDGTMEWRRDFLPATLDDVRHLEVWSMDSLEL